MEAAVSDTKPSSAVDAAFEWVKKNPSPLERMLRDRRKAEAQWVDYCRSIGGTHDAH